MGYEYYAFGNSWFQINDTSLFHSAYPYGTHMRFRITDFTINRDNALVMESCHFVYVVGSNGQVVGATQNGPDPNLGDVGIECDHMDFSDESGGGNSGGSGFPGTGTSGTGGSGGGWNDNPCRSIGASGGGNPCDGGSGSTPGWQPIGAGAPMLGYLITQLDLSSVQVSWLQNHLEIQTEIYNYLQGNADPQAANATTALHLTTMMNNPDYLQFVLGHQTTGVTGTVWWLDQTWVNNPANFWLGLTEDQQQQHLTAQEKVLIVRYPAQAFIIHQNVNPSYMEQAVRFPNGTGLNDKSDAFRHAYFNALNTRDCPPGGVPPVPASQIVTLFGNAHESETPQQLQLESEMDLFNNSVGISYCLTCLPGITTSSTISNGIMTLLNNGELRYLKPINMSDPNFNGTGGTHDIYTATHGITSATALTPTNQ
jgi:hypothetical protein